MKNIRFLPLVFAAVLMALAPMSANAQRFDVRIGEPGYYRYHRYDNDWNRGWGWRRNYIDYNSPWYWRHRHHHRPWYTRNWY